MSVDFLIYRPDIPEDCAYELCRDYEYSSDYEYEDAKGVRVKVTYVYEDELKAKYPELYPDWFEGKMGLQVTETLPNVIRKARAVELRDYGRSMDKRLQRLSGMLYSLSNIVKVCLDHPDWKLVTQS